MTLYQGSVMTDKEVLFGWTHNGYNPISVGWKQHTDNQKIQPVICEYYNTQRKKKSGLYDIVSCIQ